MNVLFLTEEPITFSGTVVRGGQIHVRNVVEGLRDRSHDVHLVDWNDNEERSYQHSLAPHIRFIVDPVRSAKHVLEIGRNMDADIVISKTRKTYLPGLTAARRLGVPHIVHVGSSLSPIGDSIFERLNAASFEARLRARHDGYFVVCDAIAEELVSRGIKRSKIHNIGNAVDIEQFDSERLTGLPEEFEEMVNGLDRFKLGFVGGLHEYKGLYDLAEALDRTETDAIAVIAGNGPERDGLEQAFGDNAVFLGSLAYEQIPAVYNAVDAFVLPSHTEGLPRVVLEAMSMTTPVLATDVGGIPEVVVDGDTGLLCPAHNPSCLARKIDVLSTDGNLINRLSQNGRAAVESEYSWEAQYDRYEQVLRRVSA